MTVYLYVVRHGEAQATATSDKLRPLTEQGRAETISTGKWLKQQSNNFSFVFASPYLRAQQTKDILLEQGLMFDEQDTISTLTPEGNPKLVVDFLLATALSISEKAKDQHILCVSHMPLVSYIIGELSGDVPIMMTAGVAKLKLDVERWSGELESLLSPEQCELNVQ